MSLPNLEMLSLHTKSIGVRNTDPLIQKWRDHMSATKANGSLLTSIRVPDSQSNPYIYNFYKETVKNAVQQFPFALMYADDNLRNDKCIVSLAMNKNPCALFFASDNLKKDKELVGIFLKQVNERFFTHFESLFNPQTTFDYLISKIKLRISSKTEQISANDSIINMCYLTMEESYRDVILKSLHKFKCELVGSIYVIMKMSNPNILPNIMTKPADLNSMFKDILDEPRLIEDMDFLDWMHVFAAGILNNYFSNVIFSQQLSDVQDTEGWPKTDALFMSIVSGK